MALYQIQIIETLVVLIGYYTAHYVTKIFVNNTLKQTHLQRGRRKMIIKGVQLLLFLTANEIALFVGTLMTALGIAFFAQWSLLSNITSSILLFFNHPIKIGDRIKVLDKDCPFDGEVVDLTYFFIHIKTAEGEITTMPNSLVLQKSISVIENKNPVNN